MLHLLQGFIFWLHSLARVFNVSVKVCLELRRERSFVEEGVLDVERVLLRINLHGIVIYRLFNKKVDVGRQSLGVKTHLFVIYFTFFVE